MEKIKITLPKPSGKTDQAAASKLQARVVVKTREDVTREDCSAVVVPRHVLRGTGERGAVACCSLRVNTGNGKGWDKATCRQERGHCEHSRQHLVRNFSCPSHDLILSDLSFLLRLTCDLDLDLDLDVFHQSLPICLASSSTPRPTQPCIVDPLPLRLRNLTSITSVWDKTHCSCQQPSHGQLNQSSLVCPVITPSSTNWTFTSSSTSVPQSCPFVPWPL